MTLASTPTTRVQLCGQLVIEHDGKRLETALPGRQGRRLFAFLALNRHRLVRREELTAALWPDRPPSAADTALNALLSKLRRTLGPDAVEGRGGVRLRLGAAWVDVEAAAESIHRAESSIALGDWTRAWGPAQVALFVSERELLPGEDAEWIEEQRRAIEEIRLRALECYSASALGIGGTELAGAIRAGRRLVGLAPLRESGYCALMRALATQGNVAEALRVYSGLCDVLRDQLGVSPSAVTRGIYERMVVI